jgi:hypothetical protein
VCKDGHLIEKAIQETLQVRADILDELLQLTKRRSGIRNGFEECKSRVNKPENISGCELNWKVIKTPLNLVAFHL